MTRAALRAAVAAASALLIAGCASDGADPGPVDESLISESPTPAPGGGGLDESVEVPDVTDEVLVDAQAEILRAGLQHEEVDADGEPVVVEDPADYVVVDQEPADGTVDPQSPVILTVEPRD